MFDYFCINCFNIVGKWKYEYVGFNIKKYCNIKKENDNSITKKLLSCKKCGHEVGILCYNVCANCFGDTTIVGNTKKLKKWYDEYEITQQSINYTGVCYTCKRLDFRIEPQPLFVKGLTFKKESKEYNKYIANVKQENERFLYD